MNRFAKKVAERFGTEMQKEWNDISGGPLLLSAFWFGHANNFYPKLRYKTSFSSSDTLALRKECEALHQKFWELAGADFEGSRRTYYEVCTTDDDQKIAREFILE